VEIGHVKNCGPPRCDFEMENVRLKKMVEGENADELGKPWISDICCSRKQLKSLLKIPFTKNLRVVFMLMLEGEIEVTFKANK
jgi:hypothetical protein